MKQLKNCSFPIPMTLQKKKWYYCLGAYEACLQPIIIHHPLIQKTGRKKDQLRLGKIFIFFFSFYFRLVNELDGVFTAWAYSRHLVAPLYKLYKGNIHDLHLQNRPLTIIEWSRGRWRGRWWRYLCCWFCILLGEYGNLLVKKVWENFRAPFLWRSFLVFRWWFFLLLWCTLPQWMAIFADKVELDLEPVFTLKGGLFIRCLHYLKSFFRVSYYGFHRLVDLEWCPYVSLYYYMVTQIWVRLNKITIPCISHLASLLICHLGKCWVCNLYSRRIISTSCYLLVAPILLLQSIQKAGIHR